MSDDDEDSMVSSSSTKESPPVTPFPSSMGSEALLSPADAKSRSPPSSGGFMADPKRSRQESPAATPSKSTENDDTILSDKLASASLDSKKDPTEGKAVARIGLNIINAKTVTPDEQQPLDNSDAKTVVMLKEDDNLLEKMNFTKLLMIIGVHDSSSNDVSKLLRFTSSAPFVTSITLNECIDLGFYEATDDHMHATTYVFNNKDESVAVPTVVWSKVNELCQELKRLSTLKQTAKTELSSFEMYALSLVKERGEYLSVTTAMNVAIKTEDDSEEEDAVVVYGSIHTLSPSMLELGFQQGDITDKDPEFFLHYLNDPAKRPFLCVLRGQRKQLSPTEKQERLQIIARLKDNTKVKANSINKKVLFYASELKEMEDEAKEVNSTLGALENEMRHVEEL